MAILFYRACHNSVEVLNCVSCGSSVSGNSYTLPSFMQGKGVMISRLKTHACCLLQEVTRADKNWEVLSTVTKRSDAAGTNLSVVKGALKYLQKELLVFFCGAAVASDVCEGRRRKREGRSRDLQGRGERNDDFVPLRGDDLENASDDDGITHLPSISLERSFAVWEWYMNSFCSARFASFRRQGLAAARFTRLKTSDGNPMVLA
ncbi:unnamed protein product [Rangifer tarandus platyrhynchus]|uniref:Yippee domain-containing protein n=1 Tax=Rangifer tarandus platyrhynchus TaxID=3082113 RepID=A0ABN8XJS6_RANTA|nr:unnamed protein product [Rangifer tarandus platyrhynchus]